jgi:leucyl-tRNA synthetase
MSGTIRPMPENSDDQVATMSEAAQTPADAAADDVPPYRYTAELANEIEARWQDRWERDGTFRAPNPVGPFAEPDHPRAGAEKLFVMDMFPYPSG